MRDADAADTRSGLPAREAVECSTRGGLPNFFSRLRKAGELSIAYFGGSITAAPGWRVYSRERIASLYPDCRIGEVHAAIGGTGSTLGVYRLERDVLAHAPSLVFIEFAVNDSGTEDEEITRCIEAIVRTIWRALPRTDICFVYTVAHESMLEELKRGILPRAASVMERIADHYEIPSINVGLEIAKMARDGKLVFKGSRAEADAAKTRGATMVFSEDGVHPFVDTGHVIYADVIERSLRPMVSGEERGAPNAVERSLEMPSPLAADNYEGARMVALDSGAMNGEWSKLDLDFDVDARETAGPERVSRGRMSELWRAAPGAALSFAFTGTSIGFYDLLGPDCGRLIVRIDHEQASVLPRFDGYCTYHRLGGFIAAAGLSDTRHTVTVTVDSAPTDKLHVLFEHNRGDLESNPEKYAGAYWYVGNIMLIGEME